MIKLIALSVLLVVLALFFVGMICCFIIAAWIAAGEPDVNGDPERDAGALECGGRAQRRHRFSENPITLNPLTK
jgi:hypothetical protein